MMLAYRAADLIMKIKVVLTVALFLPFHRREYPVIKQGNGGIIAFIKVHMMSVMISRYFVQCFKRESICFKDSVVMEIDFLIKPHCDDN